MPTAFITGGNGFLGSAILDRLLTTNHKVIAGVRSPSSLTKLLSIHPEWDASLVTSVTIPDLTAANAFDTVFQTHPDIDYIIHCAAPMAGTASNTDFVEHFEKPNVMGNLGLLQAAKKYGVNVKAVAITGSLSAITLGDQEDLKRRVLDSSQWLSLGREDAIKMGDQYVSYCVGKKLAEEAIWKFVETEKPQFSVTVFCPPLLYGPMYQQVDSIDKINFSNSLLYSIMNSAASETGIVPKTAFPGYIDVRDLATLHIAALTNASAANKRFVVGAPNTFDDLANGFRKIPQVAARVGKNNDEDIQTARMDRSEVDRVFGLKWRGIDDLVSGALESFEKLEKTMNGA